MSILDCPSSELPRFIELARQIVEAWSRDYLRRNSQVPQKEASSHPPPSDAPTPTHLRQGLQQAHCCECGHDLGDWANPHKPGCSIGRKQAEGMRAMTPEEWQALFAQKAVNLYANRKKQPSD